ncbi:MAG TPA: bifunctional [glutamate--ammonia ligase]-adenylyl-L-tyrosine phosphorylase/[glutamate--ammonia-ligase] adenylyltransferase, partial [Casimicrobiaceae bacterium]|nr:bifunctional [glutamate--ammonia ligase]-adenylyl-L-tyrosine phosphorylase/[glutamate--ammonia-ligase] adenylyltransferase [Casimicrobiaceae bacterium]
GDALDKALRRLRRDVFLHTMARDLMRLATLQEVVGNVSRCAELAIQAAVRLHTTLLATAHGTPHGAESGDAQSLIVIGMGKLGGGELNVSSDVDLVFVYPEEGETDGARPIANREFFDRLGRRVIAALHRPTADGYVFRVDMRLRPYGESGPLSVSFAALEQYLIAQGRAWERYAWLKARPLTGARHDDLGELITPFVYRKYLDYDAYEGLRDIQRQIREQEKRREYGDNIKLGRGGIREVEFVVQALQIVRGGREPALQVRGTLPALAVLRERSLLPGAAVDALEQGYVFLRNLEHRLQYRDDEQTQTLPIVDVERSALATAMGFADSASFAAELAQRRRAVTQQFDVVFGDAPASGDEASTRFASLWDDPSCTPAALEPLQAAGFVDPQALCAMLAQTKQSGRYVQLPALSKQRFDALVPRLLAAAVTELDTGTDPQTLFTRFLALLEAVSRRSAYLALLIEHPPLLPRLAQIMGASAWAATYLTQHPILLDELLDARVLLEEPDWDQWRAELAESLAAHAGDAERQMDALRHFRHAQTLRLLAQDLSGRLGVERLADHLSALADVILAAALRQCWKHVCGEQAQERAPRFAIIGYGKLGGKELGYASDLDLVFLFEVDPDEPDGDAAAERYARLAQRLNTWLTATTSAGQLYDTDLRLRPDGASGLYVSSFAAFRKYQHESAWTWEHQALTRARFVAGDAHLGAAFEAEREAILRMKRDRARLAADVVDMRRRMAAGHPNRTALFDLKHDAGGMVDIEFSVQFLVLAHAHDHPSLTRNLGNIALLRIAGELGLIDAGRAAQVASAYREYRRAQHRIRLTGAPHARVDPAPHSAQRAAVAELWSEVFGSPWQQQTAS